MFHLTETEPTRFDWRFRLFGTSVRVHPLFWILPLLLAGDARGAWRVLFWVAVVFVSILVHEFGHILAMRLFGDDGYIVLGGYGGLAISPSARHQRYWSNDVFVSAAGPLAGMLFACAIAGFGIQLGGTSHIFFGSIGIPHWYIDFSRVRLTDGNIHARLYLYEAINNLLFVNFYWSLINLLPVYPLDGGQILHACLGHRSGTSGRTRALQISIGVAAGIAALAFVSGQMHLVYMFGFLAAGTVQALYGRQTPCNDG